MPVGIGKGAQNTGELHLLIPVLLVKGCRLILTFIALITWHVIQEGLHHVPGLLADVNIIHQLEIFRVGQGLPNSTDMQHEQTLVAQIHQRRHNRTDEANCTPLPHITFGIAGIHQTNHELN